METQDSNILPTACSTSYRMNSWIVVWAEPPGRQSDTTVAISPCVLPLWELRLAHDWNRTDRASALTTGPRWFQNPIRYWNHRGPVVKAEARSVRFRSCASHNSQLIHPFKYQFMDKLINYLKKEDSGLWFVNNDLHTTSSGPSTH